MAVLTPILAWSSHTWWIYRHKWTRTEDMFAMAKIAIDEISMKYGRPTIYTDTIGQECLTLAGCDCDYDVCLDGVYSSVSPFLPVYSRLIAMSKQVNPFIFFELTTIVKQKFEQHILDAPIGYTYPILIDDEAWLSTFYINNSDSKYMFTVPDVFNTQPILEIPALLSTFLVVNDMAFNALYCQTAIKMCEDNSSIAGEVETLGHIPRKGSKPKSLNAIIGRQLPALLAREQAVGSVPFTNDRDELNINKYYKHFTDYSKNTWSGRNLVLPFINDNIKAAVERLKSLTSNINQI